MKLFPYRVVGKRTVILFLAWLLFSEAYNLIHMSLGLAASLGVALLNTAHSRPQIVIRWLRLAGFLPWLFGRIFMSGLHLAYLILHPKMPIAPRMIRYQTMLGNDTAVVLLGNSITLTPGTVTVEVNSNHLLVHAMDEESARDLVTLLLEQKVSGIFEKQEDQP
jgi:multicomponent Na+:H+ antiporter subunit E